MPNRTHSLRRDRWRARLRDPLRITHLARRRAMSLVSSRMLREYSFLPQEVLFFITYRCNLRCTMCGQWGHEGYVRKGMPDIVKNELSFEDLRPTFDALSTFRPRVLLCGGEIFLHAQWREIVEYLAKKGLSTTIITNGTRLTEAASFLVASQVEQISISLDGTPDIHDQVRAVQGTFQKVKEGIRAIISERTSKNCYYPRLALNTTITDLNYSSLMSFIESVESLGIDHVTLLHFNFIDTPLWESHQMVMRRLFGTESRCWKGFVYDASKIDVDEFIHVIHEVKKRRFSVPIEFLPDYDEAEIRTYYTGARFTPARPRGVCKGPWNTVNILPNGDISPCLDVVVGNIKDTGGLLKAWNGQEMRRFRRVVNEEKLFPVCTRCCTYYRF